MAYTKTNWVDKVTPMTAANMNKIENGIASVDSQLAESAKFSAQADFVDIIKNLSGYKRLRFKKQSATELQVVLDDGVKHITYQFEKDPNDEYFKLGQCFVGVISPIFLAKDDANTRTGTGWITSAPPSYYTTVVGDSFTCNCQGDTLKFTHYADNRGGIWEFVIDGDTGNKITVSTFSATAIASVTDTLKTGLSPYVTHNIVATFKGADPLNAPSGGTARGWVYYKPDLNNAGTITGFVSGNQNDADLLAYGSNKEFAINASKSGVSQYFPEHNNVGTMVKAEEHKFMIDNTAINIASLTDGKVVEGKTFKLIEHMYGTLPGVSGNIIELWVTYSIGIDGVCSTSGKINVLQDFTAIDGYVMMFPLGYKLNEFYTAIGNSKVNSADNAIYYFAEDKDKVFSVAGLNSSYKDYIGAMSVDFPMKTLRYGQFGRQTLDMFWYIWQRATYPKLYYNVCRNYNLTAGQSMTWSGRYAIGNIENIYHYIKG